MSVPHPGGDPNANLYAQLKRDVLDRVPQITAVEFVPDDIEAKQLRAVFDPARLDPSTGPDSPELTIKWYRQDPDGIRFKHETPSLILWEIIEELLEDVRPTYQYANEES